MEVSPAAFVWKLSTQTTPAPLTPAEPGGRDALILTPPWPSSRCTSATACPSRPRKSPSPTFTSASFAGSKCTSNRTDATSLAPVITIGTWKVVPFATDDPDEGTSENRSVPGGGADGPAFGAGAAAFGGAAPGGASLGAGAAALGGVGGGAAVVGGVAGGLSADWRICAIASGAAATALVWPGTVPRD